MNLTVDHCQATVATLPHSEDIFKALELLEKAYAVVVVDDKKPIGILTDYDMAHFFRDVTGGLVQVEDIEITLRNYIEAVLPEGEQRNIALSHEFGPKSKFDRLSFGDSIRLVTNEKNWPLFEPYLAPKDLFMNMMDQIRVIRNQLAHFKMRLNPIQRHDLEQVRYWISIRPKVIHDVPQAHPSNGQGLHAFLKQVEDSKKSDIQVSFQDMEGLLQSSLPSTAYAHESWWSNDYLNDPQSLAWLEVGWQVRDVDISSRHVTFRRTNTVLWQLFFADLLERLKKARPGITNVEKIPPEYHWSFSGGRSGFHFGWVLLRSHDLRVELYIDAKESKKLFDKLAEQKFAIENELNMALNWDRLDTRKACRVSITHPAKVTDPPDELEGVKEWAVETMLKFVDVFQPRIKGL
ncbi:hypothetical protein KSF_003650 [Reticulibacter mediterranei]|uniref:CBS domain-containing protein n=1 Tax=Reticulibacter mediterranei TaxID=2778369 RepID=A0A8J3N0I7_9CHLR|nr:DUF4268 domain-containing protein [Reticulibacter mediterranei]GHO90317.1 hypothetical protein KSF_003650 [Reticulibacter mediterranei]